MSKSTIDHDEIREWVESKGGKPAAVERTHEGGDVGIIRIMFPDSKQSEHSSLVEISWDEFFEQFDEANLALLYDEKSLFSKLIGRDTLEKREHGDHGSRHYADSHHKTDRTPGQSNAQHTGGKSHAAKSEPEKSEPEKSGSNKGGSEKADTSASKAKGSAGAERQGRGDDADDLKSREYTDPEGNVHHHTHAYQQQHGSK